MSQSAGARSSGSFQKDRLRMIFFSSSKLYARLKQVVCKDRKDKDGGSEMEKQVTPKYL